MAVPARLKHFSKSSASFSASAGKSAGGEGEGVVAEGGDPEDEFG
jgi:hypothetical protein